MYQKRLSPLGTVFFAGLPLDILISTKQQDLGFPTEEASNPPALASTAFEHLARSLFARPSDAHTGRAVPPSLRRLEAAARDAAAARAYGVEEGLRLLVVSDGMAHSDFLVLNCKLQLRMCVLDTVRNVRKCDCFSKNDTSLE